MKGMKDMKDMEDKPSITVADIKIPFWSMVRELINLAFAGLLVTIVLGIISGLFFVAFLGSI